MSGCTFSESVTWGKYQSADDTNLVQIWGEYSVVLPLLAAFVLDTCKPRRSRDLVGRMPAALKALEDKR